MPEVVARGVSFHHVRMGQGEPLLVFVHGLLLDNHSSFYLSIAPALAKHASVLLYDLRGHGRSGQPATHYRIPDMVADLAGLLDALGHDRPVVVVGHSFGGHVALEFAIGHPQRAAALVLIEAHVGTAAFGVQMAATLQLTGAERDRRIAELFGHWVAKHSARGHLGPAAAADAADAADANGDVGATLKFAGRLRRRSALVTTAERLRDHTSFVADIAATAPLDDADVRRIACPVLAFYGEHSNLRPDGDRLARLLPDCRVDVVPGGEHGILFQAPAHLAGVMLDWMRARLQ